MTQLDNTVKVRHGFEGLISGDQKSLREALRKWHAENSARPAKYSLTEKGKQFMSR